MTISTWSIDVSVGLDQTTGNAAGPAGVNSTAGPVAACPAKDTINQDQL